MSICELLRPQRALLSGIVILLAQGCSTLQIDHAGRPSSHDWLTEGRDASRSHLAPFAPDMPLELTWDYDAAAAFGPGSPLVTGEYVLVSTRKGEVHAVETSRGKKAGVQGFGESINGSPSVSGSVLFVPVAWGRKTGIVAHSLSSGNRLWRYESAPVEHGVLATGNLIVFTDATSAVHAISAAGELVWTLKLNDRASLTGTPVLVGKNTVALADDRGVVYGIELVTGEIIWSENVGEPVYASMSSLEGTLYVPTTRASLIALDGLTGRVVWRFKGEDGRVKYSTPAASRSGIVLGASDGSVQSLSTRNGVRQWIWHSKGAITAAPAIAGSQVFVGTMAATAHALNLGTGAEVWHTEVKGRIKSAPCVAEDAVYFLSEPRHLYRFSSAVAEVVHND